MARGSEAATPGKCKWGRFLTGGRMENDVHHAPACRLAASLWRASEKAELNSSDELRQNLQEVVGMLLEDGEPPLQAEFVGTQMIQVG